ncbi:hypothetical protein MHPYR_510036 [uncultured Mycobacterium sp.]|uniref:Uncharacterized protein n=1 Tax=uncultured Mycobacterium sp. TaxID=171292 RepID=A0A1Y5PHL0_9MYCO|nr:hypothetical protein MHPYR_510036 [uncultured Mycobacterium sp.]
MVVDRIVDLQYQPTLVRVDIQAGFLAHFPPSARPHVLVGTGPPAWEHPITPIMALHKQDRITADYGDRTAQVDR